MANGPGERFRPNVGAVLRNAAGLVLMAERIGQADQWQFPQGGVDEGETLEEALWRELGEELGLASPQTQCRIVAQGPPVRYRFPPGLKSRIARAWAGQEQTLFLIDFLAEDAEIRLDAWDEPEFQSFRWVTVDEALALQWETKRPIFEASLASWAAHLGRG